MKLAIDQLGFGYPDHPVGHDVSLSVTSGEVLCLLGPNGCGKTTLFKTVLGLLAPQGGTVLLDDQDLSQWPRRQIAQTLGYIPQQHDAYFPFTVLEVVLMGRSAHVGLFSTPSKQDRTVVEECLANLRITHLKDEIYTQISGGERQLTLIARALAQQPQILVMDEPTANLDFGNQVLVLNHIRRLKSKGLTIILSTHDPDQAFHTADQVAMLRDGTLLDYGPTEQVVNAENLQTLYGVEVSVMNVGNGDVRTKVCVPKDRLES